ncbi:MAG TPA: DUF5985 family protein [Candidatus Saccharimonadales bacterium]|nr:DUF5985 family protein [Candidatus Saccharimonadales bacterium]
MGELVYILCGVTSIGCAALLLRQYRITRGKLLFWSAGCFFCFAATNVLLFVDLVMLPEVDLSLIRSLSTLGGIVMLLAALIWEEH